MLKFIGKGVYSAIAIGKVSVLQKSYTDTTRLKADDKNGEISRLEKAKNEAIAQLQKIYEKALADAGEESAQIFDIHLMMIDDEDYNDAIRDMIEEGFSAEYAVAETGKSFAATFSGMDDEYMRERAADVKDISNRIISCLKGEATENTDSGNDLIICAEDLSPSETMSFDKSKIAAFVTAYGSVNSHTAILARSMGIPAIIGIGRDFLSAVKNGDTAIVDGGTGELVVTPDKETLITMREKQQAEIKEKSLIEENRGKENITIDGTKIDIFANIGNPENVKNALLYDAGGIGLFRSEFIYLDRSSYPTEEEQFEIYRQVLSEMGDKKVVIRTLDIGSDKSSDYLDIPKEENPALGLRAIRLCLARPEIFKTQLRALFRASVCGNLAIMFPMISSVNELIEAKRICDKVKNELDEKNIPYDKNTEIGIMIETPAAAVISDLLAAEADFISIGTNDLTQYVLAVDRENGELDQFYDAYHPAVLRLIRMTVDNARQAGISCGICGELAADPAMTAHFLDWGVDMLSVSPGNILPLRKRILQNGGENEKL